MSPTPVSRFPLRIPLTAAGPASRLLAGLALCLMACLAWSCAATTAPQPQAQAQKVEPAAPTATTGTATETAATAEAMASQGRSASATAPAVTNTSVAPGFNACIDARSGFGPVKLGMTAKQVQSAASWLDIDPLSSTMLSTKIFTLCGERIWNYKVRFDGDCRVRSIWFTGPKRLEGTIKRRCTAGVKGEGDPLSSFLWHCETPDVILNAVELDGHRNIYRLFRIREPENQGRCMLPHYWD